MEFDQLIEHDNFFSLKIIHKIQERGLKQCPYLIFCTISEKRLFFCYILSADQNFIAWLPLIRETLGNTCIVALCLSSSDTKLTQSF